MELLAQGVVERAGCLLFGSRGGQVVLPTFWRVRGSAVPPAVIINGGSAMKLPIDVAWPDAAVTFLLIGGQDFFRGTLSPEQHLIDIKSRVPTGNGTTAILYVREMQHVPQAPLLQLTLPLMLRVLQLWRGGGRDDLEDELEALAEALGDAGWSGELHFTPSPNDWEELAFDGTNSKTEMSEASRMKPRKTSPAAMLVSPRMSMPQKPIPAALNLILPGVQPRAQSISPPPPTRARAKTVAFSTVEQIPFHATAQRRPRASTSLEPVLSPQSASVIQRKSLPATVDSPIASAAPSPVAAVSPVSPVSSVPKIVRFSSSPVARAASPLAVASNSPRHTSPRHTSPRPTSGVAVPLQVMTKSALRRRTSPAVARSSTASWLVASAQPNIGRARRALTSLPLKIS